MQPFLQQERPCGKDKSCVSDSSFTIDLKGPANSASVSVSLLAGTQPRSLMADHKPGVFQRRHALTASAAMTADALGVCSRKDSFLARNQVFWPI